MNYLCIKTHVQHVYQSCNTHVVHILVYISARHSLCYQIHNRHIVMHVSWLTNIWLELDTKYYIRKYLMTAKLDFKFNLKYWWVFYIWAQWAYSKVTQVWVVQIGGSSTYHSLACPFLGRSGLCLRYLLARFILSKDSNISITSWYWKHTMFTLAVKMTSK